MDEIRSIRTVSREKYCGFLQPDNIKFVLVLDGFKTANITVGEDQKDYEIG